MVANQTSGGVARGSAARPRVAGGLRVAVARRLAVSHPAGLMHGAVVMGAVLALVPDDGTPAPAVAVGAAGVLVVYWLTHAFTDALGGGVGGDRMHLGRRLLRHGRRDAAVLVGGLPGLVTFAVLTGSGVGFAEAVEVALWLTLLLLGAVGHLSAHLAGVTGWRVMGEAAFAALLGACIVSLNTLLH
jgi:hypothetical protein